MITEVECRLLFAGRIIAVVAVVGFHGYQTIIACMHALLGQIDGDGQITAQMFFHQSTVDINALLAHNGLEMHKDVLARHIFWNDEMLAIPSDALIISATTRLGRFQLHGVRGTDNLPTTVIKVFGISPRSIATMKAPSLIEVINDTSASAELIKSRHGSFYLCKSHRWQ